MMVLTVTSFGTSTLDIYFSFHTIILELRDT